MATTENQVLMQHKAENGDMEILYPINRMEDVDGLPEAIARLENNQAGAAVGGGESGTTQFMNDGSIVFTTASAVTTTTKSKTPQGWLKIVDRIAPVGGGQVIIKTTIIKPGTGNVKKEITETYSYE